MPADRTVSIARAAKGVAMGDNRIGMHRRLLLARCDCGREVNVARASLARGTSKSCGCLRMNAGSRTRTHGMSKTPTWVSWMSMKDRCLRPTNRCWMDYGGRGIVICQRWLESFENFLADMGERPEGMTLDRINVGGNYEPGNCRWATPTEQRRNARHAKLDEVAVMQMRWLARDAGYTHTRIARAFGVDQTTASAAIRGDTWR